MSYSVHGNGHGNGHRLTTEELRASILAQRAELGQTVQALAAKVDVKARAKESASQAVRRARTAGREAVRGPTPWLAVAVALAAAAVTTFVVVRRRQS